MFMEGAILVKKEKKDRQPMTRKQKKKLIKRIILIVLAVAVIVGAVFGWRYYQNKKAASETSAIATDTVSRGDIEVIISGSGTVEPNERYEIIPLVNGEIINCPYEVGDYVEKGAVLYDFDTTDMELTMEKQQNSMANSTLTYEQTQKSVEDLTITAPCSGIISGIDLKVGDDVNNGTQIATITNSQTLKVTLPFNENQIKYISVGDAVTLTSSEHMSSVSGKVTHVASQATAQDDGTSAYMVTVTFENPGTFTEDTSLGGEINGQISPGSGMVEYSETKTVSAETSGTLISLNYHNGDYVRQGAVIAKLSSEDIENDLAKSEIEYKSAQLSLEETENSLDDYHITAPISGTVITKNSKTGDTIDRSNSSVTMMVIADMSKLKFTLSIDELDITKVSVGQEVSITADACEGEEFVGYVSEISQEGTASNGVTTYDATITIDEPGSLKSSMNVDAEIVVQSATNVLRVPTSDVTTVLGNNYVYLSEDSETAKSLQQSGGTDSAERGGERNGDTEGEMPEGMPEGADGEMPEGMPEGADGEMPEGDGGEMPEGMPEGDGAATAASSSKAPTAPDGFVTVQIEIGIQSDDYTEIISGLSEGDTVQQLSSSSSSSDSMTDMMMASRRYW